MTKTVKVRILDEVNCVFVGLDDTALDFFYNEFAVFAPNYYFNPKYKLGSWDGKIRFFHKTGKTYVNLLEQILPKVQAIGYKLELEDLRHTTDEIPEPDIHEDHWAHLPDPETGEPLKIRPYQVDAVNALIENSGGIALAGTGAGKTLMNAILVEKYGECGYKTITIVPSQDLIKQTYDDFVSWGLDAGEFSGKRKDIAHTHVVSTWQTLQNTPAILQQFQVVVVDECHGLKGNVLTKLLNEHGKNLPFRFGLTGTLPKAETDKLSVHVAVGYPQYEIPAHVLMEQDYLAQLHIDVIQLEENFRDLYQEYLDDWKPSELGEKPLTYTRFKDALYPEYTQEKSYVKTNDERLEWIAMFLEAKRDMGKGNVFCLVDGIQFGKKLQKLIPDSHFVYGKDEQKARKQVYDLFKDNDNLVVIATVNIASTGLNIKRIFNMVFIDMGKSFIRTIQSIGRGLRKAHDKDSVNVTDICSDLKYGKRHLAERVRFYKEAKYPYKKRKVDYRAD